jgi:hypothetical protein
MFPIRIHTSLSSVIWIPLKNIATDNFYSYSEKERERVARMLPAGLGNYDVNIVTAALQSRQNERELRK